MSIKSAAFHPPPLGRGLLGGVVKSIDKELLLIKKPFWMKGLVDIRETINRIAYIFPWRYIHFMAWSVVELINRSRAG